MAIDLLSMGVEQDCTCTPGNPCEGISSSFLLDFCHKEGNRLPSNFTPLFIICERQGVRDINTLINSHSLVMLVLQLTL